MGWRRFIRHPAMAAAEELTAAHFLNVSEIVSPKDIQSLSTLWEDIFFKQVSYASPIS